MIIDNIDKISSYVEVPNFAVEFIKNLTPDIKEGRYELPDGCFANVETYTTKMFEDAKFEAHKNYIDIQLLLRGHERIFYTAVEKLSVGVPYSQERDIMFFKDSVKAYDYLTLTGENFALIYPHEAHAPQVCADIQENVKKVVVKIKL